MLVSVVFVTYNRSDLLAIAFESLRRLSGLDRHHVEYIVADDASEPEHLDRIRDMPFDRFVLSRRNRGIGANTNAGIAAARGELILQIQDDWEFVGNPDVFRRAIEVLAKDEQVGCLQLTDRLEHVPHERRSLLGSDGYWVYENHPVPRSLRSGHLPYSDQPHLKRRAFCAAIGDYSERLTMDRTENNFKLRVSRQDRWRIAVLEGEPAFVHLGADRSFNPHYRRVERRIRLKSTPGVGRIVSSAEALVRTARKIGR